jgi:hypothetical protein
MNVCSLIWSCDTFNKSILTVYNLFLDLSYDFHIFQWPNLVNVLSDRLLLQESEEALWKNKASEPKRWRSAVCDPVIPLAVSILKSNDPRGKGWRDPILKPLLRYFCIKDCVNRLNKLWCHKNCSIYGVYCLLNCFFDNSQAVLKLLYFLQKIDIER